MQHFDGRIAILRTSGSWADGFRGLWRDIRGNAKWDLIKGIVSIIRDWWVPLVTMITASAFWFAHLSIAMRTLVLVPVAGWFIQGLSLGIRRIKQAGQIDIDVSPTHGPNRFAFLVIRNDAEDREFSVQCEVVSLRNSPNRPTKQSFNLKWEDCDFQWRVIHKHEKAR